MGVQFGSVLRKVRNYGFRNYGRNLHNYGHDFFRRRQSGFTASVITARSYGRIFYFVGRDYGRYGPAFGCVLAELVATCGSSLIESEGGKSS